jgi:hypothetical protein
MAGHLTRSDCEGSSVVDATDDTLWNESEVVGDVGSECEEDGDGDIDW